MAAPFRQPAHPTVATDSAAHSTSLLQCRQRWSVSALHVVLARLTTCLLRMHAVLTCAGWSAPVSCGSAQQRSASLHPRAETPQVHIWLATRCSAQQQCVCVWLQQLWVTAYRDYGYAHLQAAKAAAAAATPAAAVSHRVWRRQRAGSCCSFVSTTCKH
jgi:hypothetical protein